jgi:hypothetical protein
MRGARGEPVHPRALEWNELQAEFPASPDWFGDAIAHLTSGGLINSARQIPGVFAGILGASEKYYFWITAKGAQFLSSNPEDAAPEKTPLPTGAELQPSDVDDAARIYENSFAGKPYVKADQVRWATNLLEDDIKYEIEIAALEIEKMWRTYEHLFGRRGAASNEQEKAVRDPVVLRAKVRVYRALDEQRRRLGFQPSPKPGAWLTHFKGGSIGLERAPWD